MGNLSDVKKSDILPEFQAFLLDKKLVPEKNVFFFALWASKFFNSAVKNRVTLAEKCFLRSNWSSHFLGSSLGPKKR